MDTRICGTCNKEKSLDEFNFKNKEKNIRHYDCKVCWNAANKKRYQENKAYYIAKAKSGKAKVVEDHRKKLYAFYLERPCVDCGEDDPVVLQCDHVRGKKKHAVSDMIGRGNRWETIMAEIDKCEVRCANCHLRKTAKQFAWKMYKKDRVA